MRRNNIVYDPNTGEMQCIVCKRKWPAELNSNGKPKAWRCTADCLEKWDAGFIWREADFVTSEQRGRMF